MKTHKELSNDIELCFLTASASQPQKPLYFSQPSKQVSAWLVDSMLVDADGTKIDLYSLCEELEQYAKLHHQYLCGYIAYEALYPQLGITCQKPQITDLPDVFLCLFDQCTEEFTAANPENTVYPSKPFQFSQSEDTYRESLKKIHQYIQAGDCYQINYTQHFKALKSNNTNLRNAFLALSDKFEAPYAGYINTGFGEILSFSPEQFIGIAASGEVSTKPIKGTAPRGNTSLEDNTLSQELLGSDKNRAENLMIVDLLRNDLSRFCEPNSVKVSKLFDIESYTNVHHLVSTVNGQLQANYSRMAAFLSAFPGGSITGAPKLRAMQLINELETTRRNVYCGSMFYLKPNGEFNSNIMIRTLAASGDSLHAWSGGGIVADSQATEEYQESLDKISLILRHFEGQ